MRAVQVRVPGPPATHRVEELPDPEPSVGEVVVDVRAATVNYPDLLVVAGRYQNTPPLPFAPGKDGAGVVLATGAGVTRFKPGDRVLVHVESGTYATRVRAREDQCFALPPSMSFVDATSLGLASQTAWFALLERGAWRPGETILVTGATGAVGLAAVQIAASLGATPLAAAQNLTRLKSLLPDTRHHPINLAAANLRDDLRDQVRTRTAGRAADVVIDTLGGDVFDAALRALAWCGRIVTVGFAGGRIPEAKANYLLVKNIAASGLQWSDYRDRQPWKVGEAHASLSDLWLRGDLRVPVARTLPLESFAEAFELIETRAVAGRVVLITE